MIWPCQRIDVPHWQCGVSQQSEAGYVVERTVYMHHQLTKAILRPSPVLRVQVTNESPMHACILSFLLGQPHATSHPA